MGSTRALLEEAYKEPELALAIYLSDPQCLFTSVNIKTKVKTLEMSFVPLPCTQRPRRWRGAGPGHGPGEGRNNVELLLLPPISPGTERRSGASVGLHCSPACLIVFLFFHQQWRGRLVPGVVTLQLQHTDRVLHGGPAGGPALNQQTQISLIFLIKKKPGCSIQGCKTVKWKIIFVKHFQLVIKKKKHKEKNKRLLKKVTTTGKYLQVLHAWHHSHLKCKVDSLTLIAVH